MRGAIALVISLDEAARDAGIAGIEQTYRSGGKDDGLAAGDPEILAIFLFGVGKRNFVAETRN